MALERWLLNIAPKASKQILESWCLALLKDAKSASITAVVTSLVLAHPYKLFRIAAMLFRTKQFLFYDSSRLVLDQPQKASLLGFKQYSPSRWKDEMHQRDRINACDDSHRKDCLEHLALKYQMFQVTGETDEDVRQRQETLWAIWDEYYSEFPGKSKETDADKTWRLFLARMDSRTMTPQLQEVDGQTAITFDLEIDPELRRYSEESLKRNSEKMRYLKLKVWSDKKFTKDQDEGHKSSKYEQDPGLVISETKDIVKELRANPDESFVLFNSSIPAYSCAVLLRDYSDQLSADQKSFCKDIILEFASVPVRSDNYSFQVGDGVEPAISSLPELIRLFPNEKKDIASLLLLLLFSPRGQVSGTAAWSVFERLWAISSNTAETIFVGYLLLKPRYEDTRREVRRSETEENIYEHNELRVIEQFHKKHGKLLVKALSNEVEYDKLGDLSQYDLNTLTTAFELLPIGDRNLIHKRFVNEVFRITATKLLAHERHTEDERRDPHILNRLRYKLAYFVLSSPIDDIPGLLAPFVENLQVSEGAAEFLSKFVSAEDQLRKYEAFWVVWNTFYDRVLELCITHKSSYHISRVIHNYLLAWPYWKREAREWHTLKDREKSFFANAARDMGHLPAVLDSLAQFLNEIGSEFLLDGIGWISLIIENNDNMVDAELETNTLFHLESLVRRFALLYYRQIKESNRVRTQLLAILNFLVEKGSITGYLVREEIL